MNRLISGVAALALSAATACSSSKSNAAASAEPSAQPAGSEASATTSTRRQANLITSAELTQSGAQNLYQAVQILRPNWLRARTRASMGSGARTGGASAQSAIVVYLDQNKYGTINNLSQLTINGVTEMRYYDGTEATNRFGSGHASGAIVIKQSKQ
jgi:hypothetical protein